MAISDERKIELLRKTYEAFNRGDFDAAIQFAHPEIVVTRLGDQSELRGTDALRAWMEPDAFESQRTDLKGFEVVGDRVLMFQNIVSRGAGSGIEMKLDSWTVCTFDDQGLITRLQLFLAHEEDEARRALRAP